MSNNKQSSIEYLAKELNSLSFDYLVGQVTNKEHNERYDKILEQAKAMHKEEQINTFKHAQVLMVTDSSKIAEQYYNEIYGGNNEQ